MADSAGEFVEMEFTLPPGSVSPPPHVHADLTEEYEVIEGSFDVMIGSGWTTLTRARGIKGARDPRLPVYLSMLMLEYPDTLAPGRARERLLLRALAGLGRLLRFSTAVS
jgi:hypothetical protein